MTGTSIPSLAPIDRLVTNFMAQYKVPGGAVGFVKDGRLVYARGFGYADTNTLELVQPDSLFRIASLSKAVTAAIILHLVDEGHLDLDQSAFGLLDYPTPAYAGASVDPRLYSITIRHLLNHTGGWNRMTAINPDGQIGFDPPVNWTVRAAKDMGTAAPADAETVVRWMMGKPLQFDPGSQYQYSNFGYSVLGRVIEKTTGIRYEQFAQTVLKRAGISRMRIAGSRVSQKLPGEVTYYDYPGSPLTASIFPEDTEKVPWPYNFSYTTMDSHGGWVASVIDMLRFVTAVDGRPAHDKLLSSNGIAAMTARSSPPWGQTQEPYYAMGWWVRNTPGNWWHDGSLPGTRAEMVRAGNGFSWVLLFNTRVEQDNAFYTAMDNLGWQALAAVTEWPANDLFDAVLSWDSWVEKRFSSAELSDPLVSSQDADPDGDGLANMAEYAFGSDPKIADRGFESEAVIQTVNGQKYLSFSFKRLLLAHEVTYSVEISGDLSHWQKAELPLGAPALGSDGMLWLTFLDDAPVSTTPARYIRLKVARRN